MIPIAILDSQNFHTSHLRPVASCGGGPRVRDMIRTEDEPPLSRKVNRHAFAIRAINKPWSSCKDIPARRRGSQIGKSMLQGLHHVGVQFAFCLNFILAYGAKWPGLKSDFQYPSPLAGVRSPGAFVRSASAKLGRQYPCTTAPL